MQNHSISPKADNKVHPLMQLTAHHLKQRDLTRMTMPQMNMKQIFQKQSTVREIDEVAEKSPQQQLKVTRQ
jgi:hypothetical protein